jgi:hypothetical protein
MNTKYENLKSLVKTATTETLKEMYLNLVNKPESDDYDEDLAETLVFTAITGELEDRNVIKFNEETFNFEFIA